MKKFNTKWFKHSGMIFLALSLVIIIYGCNGFRVGNHFLAKPPSIDITKDTVFNNPTYAKGVLVHAYEAMYFGMGVTNGPYNTHVLGDNDPLAALTDIDWSFNDNNGGASVLYYSGALTPKTAGTHSSQTIFNFQSSQPWSAIRDSYLFLENIHKTPGMSQQTKERLKGEAMTIIAMKYARLFRNYGGMFWIDHAYSPDEDFHLPRMTARATLDSIVTLLDRAIPKLPWVENDPAQNSGRLTKAGAMGLKCRVLLFGASPLFNSDKPYLQGEAAQKKLTWYGGKDKNLWVKAKEACGALIDSVQQKGYYHMINTGNPRKDFRHGYYDRGSPELLISTRKDYRSTSSSNSLPKSIVSEGVGATTDNYVKMFPMADGTPIDKSGSGYDPTHPYIDKDGKQYRDPRLYETVLVNGAPYRSRTAELWIRGREHQTIDARNTRTGYREFKFALGLNNNRNHNFEWPYLRLPEIYLSYAEALDQVNGQPNAEACKYVNKIRNRAGLDDLPNCTTMSKKDFRDAVLRERVLELGYEEVRWYDMTRWKLKDVFQKQLYGMRICKKGAGGTPSNIIQKACYDRGVGYHESSDYIYARYKLPERSWQVNFSPKWYLEPFPLLEINKQYGLIQNPGW
jgi:hypothetical protein